MPRALQVAGVLIVAQALLLVAYQITKPSPPAAAVKVERLRETAPDLAYRTQSGAERRLSELRGAPVLLHLWATWCPPCREELPRLLAHAGKGRFRVLAVSVDPEWEEVRRFLTDQVPDAVVLASWEEVERAFGTRALPETYVIDSAGELRLRFSGPQAWGSPQVSAVLEEFEDYSAAR